MHCRGLNIGKNKIWPNIFNIPRLANGQNDKEYNFSRVIRISKNWCIRREYFSVLLHGDQEVGPIWWRRLIWSLDSTLLHNILRLSQNPQNCDNTQTRRLAILPGFKLIERQTCTPMIRTPVTCSLFLKDTTIDNLFSPYTERIFFLIIYFNNALLFKWREISQKFERWEIRAKGREQGWEEEEQAVLGRGIEYNLTRNWEVGGRKDEEKERKEEKKWGLRRLSCSTSCL